MSSVIDEASLVGCVKAANLRRWGQASVGQESPLAAIDWTLGAELQPDECWEWCPPHLASLALDPPTTARLAKSMACHVMVVGIAVEHVLQQGLLTYLQFVEPGSDEYHYVHHEIIEESQHSQMFARFVGVMPTTPNDDSAIRKRLADVDVVAAAADAPEVLFLAALTGEEPIDRIQRQMLADASLPQLLQDVARWHIKEEARHMAYARAFLRGAMPELNQKRRRRISILAPSMILDTAWLMAVPTASVLRACGVDHCIERNSDVIEGVRALVAGLWKFCIEAGVANEASQVIFDSWRPPGGRANG